MCSRNHHISANVNSLVSISYLWLDKTWCALLSLWIAYGRSCGAGVLLRQPQQFCHRPWCRLYLFRLRPFTLPPRADVHISVTFHHFEPEVFFKYMAGICRIIRDHDLSKAPIINHFNQCLVAVKIDERISGNYHLSRIAHSEIARARGWKSIRRRWLIE